MDIFEERGLPSGYMPLGIGPGRFIGPNPEEFGGVVRFITRNLPRAFHLSLSTCSKAKRRVQAFNLQKLAHICVYAYSMYGSA